MKPALAKQEHHGLPCPTLPVDRSRRPDPWSIDLLLGLDVIRHHALSPDGSRLAFIWDRGGNSDLWWIPADGSRWPVRLTFNREATAGWEDAPPRWSPDSRSLTYVAEDEIWLVSIEGGTPKKLTDHGHEASSPVFSPDGRRVYFISKRKTYGNVCWTTPEGDWPVALTGFPADCSDPQPSPDSRTVAFVFQPRADLDRWEVCLISSEGGEVRHLTGAPRVHDHHPRWSPDGSRIAFLSNRGGWREIWSLDPASGAVAALTSGRCDIQGFRWSPDGKQIVYVADHDGAGDLQVLSIETGKSRDLRAAGGWHSLPQWGPEGAWITVEHESPVLAPDLWRVEVATGHARPLTESMPPALRAASLASPEFLRYPSTGGVQVPAFLYKPPRASPDRRCAAIVYPHGGPTSEHARRWDPECQWLVAKGYAILAPNYRGSTGYGLEHQRALYGNWGVVDTEDVLAAADYLSGLAWVDKERIAIHGASYGSYLALLAMARDPSPAGRFRCGVLAYGDSEILTSWAEGDRVGSDDLERHMGHPTSNRHGYRAGSPLYDVDRIRKPLLIFHGDRDERVHPNQSERLVEALKRAGKTYEYYVYEGEAHGFLRGGNLRHYYATLERFLDWHLL